ncbi:MAG: hypothetical protein KF832_27595 [Caldilineaceae bacterium]|nr:hypothetical protein [Caldilineaceae bacterium]
MPLPVVVPIVTATPLLGQAATTTPVTQGNDNDANRNDATNPGDNVDAPPPATVQLPVGGTPAVPPTTVVPLVDTTGNNLRLTASLNRIYLWPGQVVLLHMGLTNQSPQALNNLYLEARIPAELQLESADGGAGVIPPTLTNATPMRLDWPTLAAGTTVTATFQLRVTPLTANGTLLDVTMVAGADSQANVAAIVTLAMPPTRLPQFGR